MKITKLLILLCSIAFLASCGDDDLTFEERKEEDNKQIQDFLENAFFTAEGELSKYTTNVAYNYEKFYDADCFEMVYPLSLTSLNVDTTIGSDEEFANYFLAQPGAIFNYPVSVTYNGTTHTANSDKEILEFLKFCNQELIDYAEELDSGVWIAIRPGMQGTGTSPDGTNDILIQYNLGTISDNSYVLFNETIAPIVSPFFYDWNYEDDYVDDPDNPDDDLTDSEIQSNINYREVEGFIEGISHFKPQNKEVNDLYEWQGVIVTPSAMTYGTEVSNYLGLNKNAIAVFTVDLFKTLN